MLYHGNWLNVHRIVKCLIFLNSFLDAAYEEPLLELLLLPLGHSRAGVQLAVQFKQLAEYFTNLLYLCSVL